MGHTKDEKREKRYLKRAKEGVKSKQGWFDRDRWGGKEEKKRN